MRIEKTLYYAACEYREDDMYGLAGIDGLVDYWDEENTIRNSLRARMCYSWW